MGLSATAWQAIWIALLVLAIVILAVILYLVVRRMLARRVNMSADGTQRGRRSRLGVIDTYDVDRQRRLILLRRDNVEHLVMIGGPNDVLIEPTIRRAVAQAARPQGAAQAASAAAEPHQAAPQREVAATMPARTTPVVPDAAPTPEAAQRAIPSAELAPTPVAPPVDLEGIDHAETRALAALRALARERDAARQHPPCDPEQDSGENDERDQREPVEGPLPATQIHDPLLTHTPGRRGLRHFVFGPNPDSRRNSIGNQYQGTTARVDTIAPSSYRAGAGSRPTAIIRRTYHASTASCH